MFHKVKVNTLEMNRNIQFLRRETNGIKKEQMEILEVCI